jgi:hypothetical protein
MAPVFGHEISRVTYLVAMVGNMWDIYQFIYQLVKSKKILYMVTARGAWVYMCKGVSFTFFYTDGVMT